MLGKTGESEMKQIKIAHSCVVQRKTAQLLPSFPGTHIVTESRPLSILFCTSLLKVLRAKEHAWASGGAFTLTGGKRANGIGNNRGHSEKGKWRVWFGVLYMLAYECDCTSCSGNSLYLKKKPQT